MKSRQQLTAKNFFSRKKKTALPTVGSVDFFVH
jgi:hypothetical protein